MNRLPRVATSSASGEVLEQLTRLCRNGIDAAPPRVESTGTASLDAVLPGGGWQYGTLVELMPTCEGIGELRLLMPTLARITSSERHVALIAPPYIPFAPALSQRGIRLEHFWVICAQAADILWAAEQTLRCKSFGAVLAWPRAMKDRETRRLQLAAEAGGSIGFVYRPATAALASSPAAMRLRLQADEAGKLQINVIKCRGTRAGMTVNA